VRAPSPRGTAIDARRYRRWINRFGSYRDGIINITIDSWLDQFEHADKDLAARVLDAIEYYGQSQVQAAYRQALQGLPGWNQDPEQREGRWCFAAMSGSAGESGDAMLYQFRLANGLDAKKYNDIFASRSELFRRTLLSDNDPKQLGKDDVVVLLDDFTGTGRQVCDAWNNPETSFGSLLAGVGKVYLIVVAAAQAARAKIAAETTITLVPSHQLHDGDNVFSKSCPHFSARERRRLLHYGTIADNKNPKGFGDCGLLIVFQHRAPNNTVPILHVDHNLWTGLFPRHT
jgi:hypothetical protein